MKTLKLDHTLAEMVTKGSTTTTWRINDDKNLSVNDKIEFIDKVDPKDKNTWVIIGVATINTVVSKRLGEVSNEERKGQDFTSTDVMYKTLRGYYGKEVGPLTPVKIIQFDFKTYPSPRRLHPEANYPLKVDSVKLYADGGSRGNPGPSASGYVLTDMEDNVVIKSGIYIGVTTNNQAEYLALKYGMEEALKLQAERIHVYLDSLLVINQMKGIFKVRNRDLWPIHESIQGLVKRFHHVSFTHVPRELNKLADAQVNIALDAQTKS